MQLVSLCCLALEARYMLACTITVKSVVNINAPSNTGDRRAPHQPWFALSACFKRAVASTVVRVPAVDVVLGFGESVPEITIG